MQTLTPTTTIDHPTALRLREMLGRLQLDILQAHDIPPAVASRIVVSISEEGFQLIDQLEGVIR